MARPIYEIALEIKSLWKKPYFGAVPYLDAMVHLNSIDDYFFLDSAKEVVLYFLANASTFRGEDARRLKAELKSLVQ
jgi:hypothetical protein